MLFTLHSSGNCLAFLCFCPVMCVLEKNWVNMHIYTNIKQSPLTLIYLAMLSWNSFLFYWQHFPPARLLLSEYFKLSALSSNLYLHLLRIFSQRLLQNRENRTPCTCLHHLTNISVIIAFSFPRISMEEIFFYYQDYYILHWLSVFPLFQPPQGT